MRVKGENKRKGELFFFIIYNEKHVEARFD
jgi:hypothetical protein